MGGKEGGAQVMGRSERGPFMEKQGVPFFFFIIIKPTPERREGELLLLGKILSSHCFIMKWAPGQVMLLTLGFTAPPPSGRTT